MSKHVIQKNNVSLETAGTGYMLKVGDPITSTIQLVALTEEELRFIQIVIMKMFEVPNRECSVCTGTGIMALRQGVRNPPKFKNVPCQFCR
jgi:hypothetical protein